MGQRVQGKCPWCGRSSLFLGAGDYITCSTAECSNPTGVTDLLDGETGHVVVILETGGFTIQHPMRERAEGELFDCGLHQYLSSLSAAPIASGKYRVRWDDCSARWERLA